MENKISQIESLIVNNEFSEAAMEMKAIFEMADDESLLNEALLILSRINNIKRKSDQGVVDYLDPEFNKIRLSLINLKSSAKTVWDSDGVKVPEERPDKMGGAPKLIFEENFENNNNGWEIYDDSEQVSIIKNRRYIIENRRNDIARSYTIPKEINEKGNFRILGRFTFLDGTETNEFGLKWGESEDRDGFNFSISPNGYFIIGYFIEKKTISLKTWTENPIINRGNKANVLEVIKNNEVMHFKINGEVVHSESYLSFFGPRVGFYLGSSLRIGIDYFQIFN